MNTVTVLGASLAAGALAATAAPAGVSSIRVTEDYMTSGFFQGNHVRGEEAGSSRAVNRATSASIFGVTGETAYFGFGFDPGAFGGPVARAVFRVEIVANGFFADPSPGNPADISVHNLTADPLASISDTDASGADSFTSFRDSQITTSSIVSTISVDGLGVYDWDITALVNEWIANGDTNYAYTIGTSALLDPDGDTAIGFVNSSWIGLTDEVTARIVIVPAPGAAGLLTAVVAAGARRRRR